MEAKLREQIAAIQHDQWSNWMKYLFEKCDLLENGARVIPAWAVERWTRQMNTPYSQLSEEEKESDRLEADKLLQRLSKFLGEERQGE